MLYLIDMENVGYDGLIGIEDLSEKDTVMIIYSEVFEKKIEHHICKIKTKARVKIQEVSTGYKDALDFKMITYALLMYRNGYKGIVFVSKDNGYLSVRDTIVEFGLNITLLLGFAPDLIQIPVIYNFEGGSYTKYEIQCNKYRVFDGREFNNLDKPLYIKTEHFDYLAVKKQKKAIKELETVETREESFNKFIKENGIVKEEGVVELTEKKVYKPHSMNKEERKVAMKKAWENLIVATSEWAESQNADNVAINGIKKMAKKDPLPRNRYLQILSAIMHVKMPTIQGTMGKLYGKYMLIK